MKQKFDINKGTLRILLHIGFWISYLLFFTTLQKLNSPNFSFGFILVQTAAFSMWVDILATYFTIYVLMPRFLYTKKYIIFSVGFILSALFSVLLVQFLDYYVYIPNFHPDLAYKRGFWEFPYFFYLVATYAVVVLAAAIKLGKRWLESQNRQKELEKQSLKSELAMLKHQISPHFLFNTLNNIDSLISEEPEKASATIIRLSDIMRYMLYNSQDKEVLLSKEIEYVHNLVKLQSLRMTAPNFIQLEIEGKAGKNKIAPLLFVPFIENAIKHGDKSVPSPGIQIKIAIHLSEIDFEVINFIDKHRQKDPTGGIGLQNVSRRLELLYPEKHVLDIVETEKTFKVNLKIPLTR